MDFSIFCDERAKADAGIEIAGKIQIQNCSGVNAAASGFELVDDFHGANFRRAAESAGREAGHQSVKAVDIFAQLAAKAGDEMHDVRVAFDEHEALDADGTVFADAA